MAVSAGVYYSRISRKLTDALRPQRIAIIDESHKHAGHRENSGLGETHFSVEVVSKEFEGLKHVARHRKVYEILEDELHERVHALSLVTRTPEEDN